ncbi:MAG TPA: substrate-binding domain-containing protein, partial [Pengzhenrongella sp.]
DVMAWGAMRAATDLGLRVPQDVSVVGFDDAQIARRVRPALTTVRQDIVAKGRVAAAQLTAAIERRRKGEIEEPPRVVMPTELIVRHSTAPPPQP